ncbi:hypothetical protein CC78DRAFT_340505 [Lojkania enalia]|uniref:Uncharacterized protein n=1 Tax=Lojkania enalia TaxID=147567 RepID=A0A9P4MXV5_9PLEO|nr:hypothetical protein CC78DRAFT_340505 [Didymosphaeria enalia]
MPGRKQITAAQLAQHLSYKSSLALLPPSSITRPIEDVRRVHDKHFTRWPPHINLIYPFLASNSEAGLSEEQGGRVQDPSNQPLPRLKQDIRSRIETVVRDIQPFHVALSADPAGVFHHGKKNKTVWLDPLAPSTTRSATTIHELQAALQSEFAECDADGRPFTPHLSLGGARSDKGAQDICDAIRNSIANLQLSEAPEQEDKQPIVLNYYVDKVFVIARKGFHDRFQIIGAVELGKK